MVAAEEGKNKGNEMEAVLQLSTREVNQILRAVPEYQSLFKSASEYQALISSTHSSSCQCCRCHTSSCDSNNHSTTSKSRWHHSYQASHGQQLKEEEEDLVCDVEDVFDLDCRIVEQLGRGGGA